MTAASPATLRESFQRLLERTVAAVGPALGYRLAAIAFGAAVELTLEKRGATFVAWVRPGTDEEPCYRATAKFRLGHRGNPPDRLGFVVLDALLKRITAWEAALPDDALPRLFGPVLGTKLEAMTSADDETRSALLQAGFEPIYAEWREAREARLAARFEGLSVSPATNVLLVNATRGLQFYPSIVDFFLRLSRTQPNFAVTGAGYFPEIVELHEGIAAKGLRSVSIDELMTWKAAEVNRFKAVLFVGPSDVMARFMTLPGVTARLVLLDLGFYHQILETHPAFIRGEAVYPDLESQVNPVAAYSCQAETKVAHDLGLLGPLGLFQWRWFDYIPIGFAYTTYYRSDRRLFDVALLGSSGRDYGQIDPALFRGLRFLFLGRETAAIERLREHLDVTVVSRVDEDTYARLLALSRCVVFPAPARTPIYNVFLSVVDTIASGKPLVTTLHAGIERLAEEGVPATFYDATPVDLFRRIDSLVGTRGRLEQVEAEAIQFAKERLDIYRILGEVLEERILS